MSYVVLSALLLLAPTWVQAAKAARDGNCSDVTEVGLNPDGSCCFEHRFYDDFRTYVWKFFRGMAIKPWMEFPHRIPLLKRGLQDLEAGGCLSMGVSFVHLMETYSIIITATPLMGIGKEAAELVESPLDVLFLREIMTKIMQSPVEERREWPCDLALQLSAQLILAVKNELSFPSMLKDQRWLSSRCGVPNLPVPPTQRLVTFSYVGDIPKVVLSSSEQQEALEDVLAVLKTADVEFFPTQGTLIGLVRYGELHGNLSAGKVDVVDRDMDWMVRADTLASWFGVVKRISDELLARGWFYCVLMSSAADAMVWAGQLSRMKCIRSKPFLAVADFEAYSVDGEALQTGFCECEHLIATTIDGFFTENGCSCTGRAFTLENVLPLQSCRFYEQTAPCPRRPAAYLAELYPTGRCFAIPTVTEFRAPNDARNSRLITEGLNASDVHLLRRTAAKLHKGGHASFLEEFEHCDFQQSLMLGDFARWEELQEKG